MNTLRHTNGRFARNPVTSAQFWDRVQTLAGRGLSIASAEQQAADEFRLRLICDEITGEVVDWTELRRKVA